MTPRVSLLQQQVRPGHPDFPGLGGLRLSHDWRFLLRVVSVHATLWRGAHVSTGTSVTHQKKVRKQLHFKLIESVATFPPIV